MTGCGYNDPNYSFIKTEKNLKTTSYYILAVAFCHTVFIYTLKMLVCVCVRVFNIEIAVVQLTYIAIE